MRKILLGTVFAGLMVCSAPSASLAQGGLFGIGPTLPASSWQPRRDFVFSIFNPSPNVGVDNLVPDTARPGLNVLNRIVFRTTGVSRVTRFFGIR